jgi:tetratricopeptide (TPR) repeat protein
MFPWWLWLGLLIGFTAQAIATILFLLPLVSLACVARWQSSASGRAKWWTRLAAVALLFLGVSLGTAPTWIHNYFIARDTVLLSAHSGVNFWIGNNPWATGYPRFPPGLHAGQEAMLKDSITEAEREVGRPLKRSEVSAYWTGKARAYIRDHFDDWLRLLGTKIANFWNAFQYDDLSIITMLREEGVIFPGIKFGLVAALALPGVVFAWRKFPLSRWVAGAVLLHMISLLSVFVTERYRLAVVPGLLLFAAAGLWELWNAVVSAKYGRGAFYLSILALSVFLVSMPKADASLWALDSYNSGVQALESEKLAVAEQKLQLAYAYVPANAELNFALGNLRLAQGNKAAAKAFYIAALRLNPRHEGTYNNLGVIALGEQRWDLASEFFGKALDENPRDPKTLYLLANAQFHMGDLPTALVTLGRAMDLSPMQPEFLALRQEIEEKLQPEHPR